MKYCLLTNVIYRSILDSRGTKADTASVHTANCQRPYKAYSGLGEDIANK